MFNPNVDGGGTLGLPLPYIAYQYTAKIIILSAPIAIWPFLTWISWILHNKKMSRHFFLIFCAKFRNFKMVVKSLFYFWNCLGKVAMSHTLVVFSIRQITLADVYKRKFRHVVMSCYLKINILFDLKWYIYVLFDLRNKKYVLRLMVW